MKWKIYKVDRLIQEFDGENNAKFIIRKEIEEIKFWVKLEYKNESSAFSITFPDSKLENIKRIEFAEEYDLIELDEIETLIMKDKFLKAIKKYIKSGKIYTWYNYGEYYKERVNEIIQFIKMEEK